MATCLFTALISSNIGTEASKFIVPVLVKNLSWAMTEKAVKNKNSKVVVFIIVYI
ncbi:hypothetical protein NU08_3279 [Flavobacterium anhuiense]|uniref:Uncharacterized protein n=1 Tax=Flavobacterium anhuiense TaxID=459526 RepID=A0A444VVQ5_9FLAO|nr:hypothetical protein NU08_3279 [Flavobacterium anhuiense]